MIQQWLMSFWDFIQRNMGYFAAVFGTATVIDSRNKQKQAEAKADALEKRNKIERILAGKPDGDAERVLKDKWRRD